MTTARSAPSMLDTFTDATPVVTGSDLGVIALLIVNALGAAFTVWVKAKYDQRFNALENDLKGCQEKHAAAERSAAAAVAKVSGLERQNGEQQGMIDKLTTRIVDLVTALHRQGLSAGSGPNPALTDETGEHDPLPPG